MSEKIGEVLEVSSAYSSCSLLAQWRASPDFSLNLPFFWDIQDGANI